MAGSTSIEGGKASIWRPPWFETQMPFQGDRLGGIERMQDALEHHGPLPAVAETGDLVPGEGAAELAPGEADDLVAAGVLAGISLDVRELGSAVPDQRHEPAR
jgi:hypothetical protein